MKRTLKIAGALLALFPVWFYLLPNGGNPRTVREAVERLKATMPPDHQAQLSRCSEDELIDYHMSLGRYIRNEYGLWQGNLRLVLSMGHAGAIHADGASYLIIKALWEDLRSHSSEESSQGTSVPKPS